MVEGSPPGDALPPYPQRATPARKGARCGAGAWSPRPHRPYPGHTGRGTLAARSRGRAAGGGTAPDTRRPSQRWQATPPGDCPPPPPRHTAPTGHAGQGDSVGPPHPHTRAHSTSVADPNDPSSGRAAGGGTAPDLRRPSQSWKAPPPGTPFRHPHSEQRRPATAHAVRPVLGPHARTDRTRDTRVAEPWLPAPEVGRSGEGQPLTPDAPHNGGRQPPQGTAPHHPRGTQPPQGMQAKETVLGPHNHTSAPTAREWQTPTARPVGGQSGWSGLLGVTLETLLGTAGLVAFCPSSAAFSQLIENPSSLRCRFLTKYSFCIFSKTREPVESLENPPMLSSISIRRGA